MIRSLRALLVEDFEDDALLLVRELERAGYDVSYERVDSAERIEAALARQTWDIVISDHGMPSFTGVEALTIVRSLAPDVPFIFVSGSIGEDAAVAAMRAGAQDYVMKDNIRRLVPAVARELHDAEGRLRERLAEEQARATGELVRSVFAASPLAIVATDLNGIVTLWNPAAEQLFGWTAAETIGKENPTVLGDGRPEREARRARALRGDAFESLEAVHQRKDGSLVEVSVSIATTNDRDGRPDGFTVVLQDLTDRKLLEAQFLQSHKMEAVGRLASGIAHDFNNLLTVITSYSELLLQGMPPDDPQSDDVGEIHKAAHAAAVLTRRLLSFSRKDAVHREVVDLNVVVTEATGLLKRIIGEGVELHVQLDPGIGFVMVDARQIEQVIMNLVVNARDAMPEGGTLVIATRRTNALDPLVRGTETGPARRYATLVVTDTGTGMDEATQAHIFEPFFTTKAEDKGTGLGLATVHGIVAHYDGVIQVRSAPGAGTSFIVSLPSVDWTGSPLMRDLQPSGPV